MSRLIKEVEGVNYYSNRNAIVKTGSRYTVVIYNKYHSAWLAGNATAATPEGAVDYATDSTLVKFRTIKAAIKSIEEYC